VMPTEPISRRIYQCVTGFQFAVHGGGILQFHSQKKSGH
jgi:hypothetical protein